MEHLTDADITAYCSGTLAPAHLLSADEHLQTCADCRRKALGRAGNDVSAVLPGSPHLTYEEIEAYADARLDAAGRERVISHLDLCPQCRAEADDLCQFRVEAERAPRKSRARWIIAVAAAIVVAILGWRLVKPAPSEFAGVVDEVLRQGRIDVPAGVLALRGKVGALRGNPERPGFALLRPVATAVASARPRFEWSAAGTGARYVVSIFDPQLHPVAHSESLLESNWTPSAPLAPGEYLWQVVGDVDGKPVVAPGPADPAARFLVLEPAQTQSLDRAAKEHPGDHMLLGILYGRAGLLDDADRELRAADPRKAKPLLENLR